MSEGVNEQPKIDRLIPIMESVLSEGLRIGVILWVHGCMIAGTMVDRETYNKVNAQLFSKSSNEVAQLVGKHMTEAASNSSEEAEKPSNVTREFIYLTDVSVCMGNQWVRYNDSCWKGRISSIDGFTYGTPS